MYFNFLSLYSCNVALYSLQYFVSGFIGGCLFQLDKIVEHYLNLIKTKISNLTWYFWPSSAKLHHISHFVKHPCASFASSVIMCLSSEGHTVWVTSPASGQWPISDDVRCAIIRNVPMQHGYIVLVSLKVTHWQAPWACPLLFSLMPILSRG